MAGERTTATPGGVESRRWLCADLPEGVGWHHIYGAGWLAGIGFTMSLFVADLAFAVSDGRLLAAAKLGILVASLIAGVGGWLILSRGSSILRR